MGLINLRTNLKDLKFGNDEPRGGNSNQPFIQTRVPATDEPLQTGISNAGPVIASVGAGAVIGAIGGSVLGGAGTGAVIGAAVGLGIGIAGADLTGNGLRLPSAGTGGPDFLIRGGTLLPGILANDAIRLTKYFASTEGVLFTVKQNLLSRTAVRTQASTGLLNGDIYTPLSTLSQAVGNAFGLHVNKQGLNPFAELLSAGDFTPNQYADKIARETFEIENSPDGILKNRLFALYESKIQNESLGGFAKVTNVTSPDDNVNLISYQGGPGSTLGIGKTNIKFADQRTGVNNPLLVTNPLRFYGREKRLPLTEYLTLAGEYKPFEDSFDKNILRFLGASAFYEKGLFDSKSQPTNKLTDQSLASVIKPDVTNTFINPISNNTETYTQQQLEDISLSPSQNGESFLIGNLTSGPNKAPAGPATPGDFRKILKNQIKAPDYTKANIEQRVNLGNPGTIGKPSSYTTSSASPDSYDKINASVLYQNENSQGTDINNINNDLVKFRIGVIDNDTPTKKTYIHFRAFLDQISDSYNADWQSTKYIGRGENFYTYNGFNRKVSLSWTVAAQSKKELIPMYKKLNYLASVITPDYSKYGYMRGNLVTLTIGGYFYEQPGIITDFSYDMNEDNDSWEIGINDSTPVKSDSSVKELPHIIRVKGFNFIPIHEFVPRLQQNNYGTLNLTDTSIDNNTYGDERYIALSTGGKTNYDKL
jgi:hypothetical protein